MSTAVVRGGIGGTDLERLRVVLAGSHVVLLPITQLSAVVVRGGIAWVELDGLVEIGHRFFHASGGSIAHATVMNCAPNAVQTHGRFEIGQGLRILARLGASFTAAIVRPAGQLISVILI